MATSNVTAADRLSILLPWINGDPLTEDEVSSRITRFLGACSVAWWPEGHAGLIGLEAEPHGAFTARQADRLRRDLHQILEDATEPPRKAKAISSLKQMLVENAEDRSYQPKKGRRLPSLHYRVMRERSRPNKLPASARERRAVEGSGAIRLIVQGRLRDLVIHSVMRTLTEPGTVTLSRCPAPAPEDWTQECGRFVISGGGPGRPRWFCNDACRNRDFRKRNSEKDKKGK